MLCDVLGFPARASPHTPSLFATEPECFLAAGGNASQSHSPASQPVSASCARKDSQGLARTRKDSQTHARHRKASQGWPKPNCACLEYS